MAFVLVAASLLLVAFVYSCVSVVHQLLGSLASRRVRRVARVVAPAFAALRHGLERVSVQRRHGSSVAAAQGLGYAALPLTLAAWVWLLFGAGAFRTRPGGAA